eukprot:TRINITY_DN6763_c0_g5_i1.p1 TRINITY_DN6763_c0_g5~~TRINITY_DN6763_c0_g5_i1.p1  ORF type:complete len:210 (+),score=66.31 TRINITY_DN6763_c0_g5_i1:101-730(+)
MPPDPAEAGLRVSRNEVPGVPTEMFTVHRGGAGGAKEIVYCGFGTRGAVAAKFAAYWTKSHAGAAPAWVPEDVPLEELVRYDVVAEGTPFQQAVWAALRKVGAGETTTYGALAAAAGRPAAARAVGSAMNRNPVSYFIPCHRVVRQGGGAAAWAYGWGCEVKRQLLTAEGVTQASLDARHGGAKRTRLPASESEAPASGALVQKRKRKK